MKPLDVSHLDTSGLGNGVYGVNVVDGQADGWAAAGGTVASTRCRLRAAAAQPLPHNVVADVTWDTEEEDTSDFWSDANPADIVIPTTGLYRVEAYCSLNVSTSGLFIVNVGLGGTLVETLARQSCNTSPTAQYAGGSVHMDLNALDVITLSVFQNSGAARNTYVPTPAYYPRIAVELIA